MTPAPKSTELVFAIMPVIWGLIFIGLVPLNHALFLSGISGVGFAIFSELVVLAIGFIASFAQAALTLRYFWHKRWPMVVGAVISVAIWLGCIAFGIEQGAAIVYAT